MKTVTVEFPLIGYAEVEIEVEDDATPEDILRAIRNDDIQIIYDGHEHVGTMTPMLDLADWRDTADYNPTEIGVIE